MKLITEHMQDLEYIVEGKGKDQYIRGVFMQSDVKNQNGRVRSLESKQSWMFGGLAGITAVFGSLIAWMKGYH